MIIEANGSKILENFRQSVMNLVDDIEKQAEWIENNDPDPERTTNYMVDKKMKEWFKRGGNLGY